MISRMRMLSFTKRALYNYMAKRPLAISFEVTHNCNARCKQCHLGGRIVENQASPEQLGRICHALKPVVAQISGGEPLLRHDLLEIVHAFKRPGRAPYIDITTNGLLLTTEKYYKLLQAGVDQVAISLDYPDERHDEFRRVPGLFQRIKKVIESLNHEKCKDITLICVVQRDNYKDLVRIAQLAADWRVKVSFSAYTWLRTFDKSYLLNAGDIKEFRRITARLIEMRKRFGHISTTPYVWDNMAKFFENRSWPNCRTGWRFHNVNPDGTFSPCGLIIKDFRSQRELREKFSRTNTCTSCYTSIRGNTEKPIQYLFTDYLNRWQKVV
jgi:MoaA/NifB/PqqE/SkfB family radical SAM enzyme